MNVEFTPEQEAQLSRVATQAGMDAEHFVKDAALRMVEEKSRFSAAVREASIKWTEANWSMMMRFAIGWSSENGSDAHQVDTPGRHRPEAYV